MGCAGSSEVTCTVAVAAMSISPGWGTGWFGETFTMCFRSMAPPWLFLRSLRRTIAQASPTICDILATNVRIVRKSCRGRTHALDVASRYALGGGDILPQQ